MGPSSSFAQTAANSDSSIKSLDGFIWLGGFIRLGARGAFGEVIPKIELLQIALGLLRAFDDGTKGRIGQDEVEAVWL